MHQIWFIAGPNGSGKTTLARRYLAGKLPVINPDDLAQSINPAHPEALDAIMRSGRKALALQAEYVSSRQSFALETTFSGNREIALMRHAKAAGYKVNLVFVCTDSPLLSMGRIALRVRDGGHHVPGADVERRYRRSLENLPEGLVLADRAWLLDNTQPRMRLVASLERGTVKSMSSSLPRWIRSARLPPLEQANGLFL